LEVLNKSGVVLVCAFWEAFCEDLAFEALEHLVSNAKNYKGLPKRLQQQVATELKDDRDQLAVWRLADEGWRAHLRTRMEKLQDQLNRELNTPKSAPVDDFFERSVGISGISNSWKWPRMSNERAKARLDEFVTLRGDIAHRGKASEATKKKAVTDFLSHVTQLVTKTDDCVNASVDTACGVRLW